MFKNKAVFYHTIASLLLGQSTFWLVFLHRNQLPPLIPLWFMKNNPQDMLASVTYIWLLPALSIGFLALYLVTTAFIYRRQPFIVNTIMSASTYGSVFLFVATVNILGKVLGWV
ncbi:hypothetical protein GW793_04195 [bacterium]|uniref:DUF1648 domain-containing protein n=2 Tax=Katanobacteria TaxID=422282 RepID=A0A2M7X0C9_UNCKA|nr:hypothetical protein [bacterium]PIP56649.1 MAG: hypothetical protein COX05_02025 [candidate division WWE3 bacterium CG22_combo_CG10-13_8_21_14_all_39_12]PJA39353.1 MAG: hypothetical protein CO179_05320 [candidate division WWE3 bacterium CG_4_9_14_3_um_filter_39_7]